LRKIFKRILDTIHISYRHFISKKNNPNPPVDSSESIFLAYGEKARNQGFDQLNILLSFDCDTPEDIPAAEALFLQLSHLGIQSIFAVPGAQLQAGETTFRRMADHGAIFINHGARPHAEWRDGRYHSITFYKDMTLQEVREDIIQGDAILKKTIGKFSKGFRAPHFGSFQSPDQRQLIYQTLKELGYLYSSSTLPVLAYANSPVIKVDTNLYEIPLSGSFAFPEAILDSWNYVQDYYNPKIKMEYADLFIGTVENLLSLDVVGVLNYYIDPFHVYQTEAFDKVIDFIVTKKLRTIVFDDLIGDIEGFKK
jgi:hypothetical protein